MAAGLPVVATPNHGARFVTDEGRFGVLSDLQDIAGPLIDLLGDQEHRRVWSARSSDRAGEFDLARVATMYESIYRSGARSAAEAPD